MENFIAFSIVLLAVNSGVLEAILWGRKGHLSFNWNEHIILVSLRVLFVVTPVITATITLLNSKEGYPVVEIYKDFVKGVSAGVFMFSLFHTGFYNYSRMRMNKESYPFTNIVGAFKHTKKEKQTEKINIGTNLRIIYFLIGSLILITSR